MGNLLPSYKKAVIDDIINGVAGNTSQYYAFAANPVGWTGNTPSITSDDYTTTFSNDWQMIFGKRLSNTNFAPIILNNLWVTNTVYNRYDNTVANLTNYYVITAPSLPGGDYLVYKCIDNANGAPSIQIPDQVQSASFTKSDGYTWRYITSISAVNYTNFYTSTYAPIYANATTVASAYNYSGVEVIMINNGGVNYNSYNDGIVRGIVNSTVIQIESTASTDNDFYTKNGIYIYNVSSATSQLRTVSKYVSNLSGNWVYLDSAANTSQINPSVTQYKISPKIAFTSDADSQPAAYTIINPSTNSIANVVIVDTGYGVSWANVVVQSNSTYGTGANLYAIVPPAGGHGFNPVNELKVQGLGVYFTFSNTESSTITTEVGYNKIGLIKNPYLISNTGTKQSNQCYSNTFTTLLKANTSPPTAFTTGLQVVGQTSGAVGTVAFSNTSVLYLTGDKRFTNNEYIVATDTTSSTIQINSVGTIYTKDLYPMYIQNITNVTRSNNQSESYKLIIQM